MLFSVIGSCPSAPHPQFARVATQQMVVRHGRRLLGVDELSRQVLKLFIAMGAESLDLHTLFEAGGNDPASRERVLDVVTRLGFDGEIEVTSYRGSVREACLWSAGLAEPAVRRRASILDRGEQITDAEPDDCPVRPVGRWIVDPDGAVVRAGLVRHYAVRHGLWQLDPKIAYLSGDRLPPATRGFEVIENIPFGERRLRQALAEMDCGAAEILVRGVDLDPALLRPRLRLRGTRSLSVVITRIGAGSGARATAFICRPSR